ncbi:MAG: EAL domain-containing protein [Alphaproteobacteria bacterium]
MRLTISQRISLAFGLLLFLFFITSAVTYLLTSRIEQDVSDVAAVEDPREAAAIAVNAGLAELSRDVAVFNTGRGDNQQLLVADRAELDDALAALDELIPPDSADANNVALLRAKVTQAQASAGRVVGAAIDLQGEAAALRQLGSRLLGSLRSWLAGNADNADLRGAVLDMMAAGEAGLGAALTYLTVPEPAIAAALETAIGDFQTASGRFRAATSDPAALAWLDATLAAGESLRRQGTGLVEGARRLQGQLDDFNAAVAEARAVVGDRLVPSIRAGRRAALSDLATSTETSLIYLLVMTGFGVFVGAGASVLLSNGILRPVQELTEGAEAFGAGQLSHRIDIGSEDEFGRLARAFNRMAESRQRAEEALRQLAHHDPLTKLPNRTLFQIRLVEALENARRTDRMVAVHFLDLDHFKDVNDTLGHPAGDLLLQHVSGRLSECVRRSDTVARLGGDEFAIIQTNLDHQRGIAVLAQRIIDSLSKPFDLDGEIVYTGTSVGITVYPQDDAEAEMLIKDADMALYRAKQEGRGKYQLYNPGMNDEVQARKTLEQELRKAIEREEFFLTYQPQIELADGHVVGAEALIRWQHPEQGLISPGDFIPVAEQAGLITKLTEFVLRESCKQAKGWQNAGLGDLRVSVNLSPVDFKRPDLIALMNRILTESGLQAKYLHLEITEGMVMSGIDSAIETLSALSALGIELSIDDFGTGYSSMNYLKQFPVGGLKIDQSFVRDILVNRQDASITKAIIKVGHSLNLKVIAEGVETREQMDFLRLRACDEVQGYWISRPLAPEQFAEFVAKHEPHSFLHGTTTETDDAAE